MKKTTDRSQNKNPLPYLNQLLQKADYVDFTRYTGGRKPSTRHYYVYTVENVTPLTDDLELNLSMDRGSIDLYADKELMTIEFDTMKDFLSECALIFGVPEVLAYDYKFKKKLLKQFLSSLIH